MATTTVTIRVDDTLKLAATEAFEGMGLSLANGISVYLTRVAATKCIPFKVEVPVYTPSPAFGLTGDAYKKHLIEAKKRIGERVLKHITREDRTIIGSAPVGKSTERI